MTRTYKRRGIFAISQNTALLALFTGYGLGRSIPVKTYPELSQSPLVSANPDCRLLVIDCRSGPLFVNDREKATLKKLETLTHIPVLFIYAARQPNIPTFLDHFHFFTQSEILTNPEQTLSRFIDDARHYERRCKDRRMQPDRRGTTQYERRNGEKNDMPERSGTIKQGSFEVNYSTKTVHCEGKDLQLTRKEFDLFTLLTEKQEQVCSTQSILEQLWPDTARANKSDLYQYMHTLRKKVEQDPCQPQRIITIKGIGYQLRL